MRWVRWAILAGLVAASAEGSPAPATQAPQALAQPDLAKLKAAYERDAGDARAAIAYVAGAMRLNQPELARPVLYALLSRPADVPPALAAEAWFQMGHVHLRAQEYEEAVACWATVVRDHRSSDRASAAAVNAASLLLQVIGDADRAFTLLTARLRDHTIDGPHVELAHLLLFQIYVDRRQYADARGLLGTLPSSGPRHALIQEAIPVVLWKTGDQTAARRQIESLFERAADDASALNNLAGTLAEHGVALETALAAAARAVVLSPDARHDVWDTYAGVLFASGQYDKAVAAGEKAVALAKDQKDQTEYKARLETYKAAARKAPGKRAGER